MDVTVYNDNDMPHPLLREKPLAMYVFTESKKTFNKVIRETSAGGVSHNDTMMHFSGEAK